MFVYLKPCLYLENYDTSCFKRDFLPPDLPLLWADSTKHSFEFLKEEKGINNYNRLGMYFAFSLGKEGKRRQHRAKGRWTQSHVNSENLIRRIFREITEDRHSISKRN